MDAKLPLLITMGDPNGVGPEISLKAYLKASRKIKTPMAIVGDLTVLEQAAKLLKIRKHLVFADSPEAVAEVAKQGIPVIDGGVRFEEKVQPGKMTKEAGRASIGWVRTATALCLLKRARAIVTAPLCKESVEKTVPEFQGHTEFIGEM